MAAEKHDDKHPKTKSINNKVASKANVHKSSNRRETAPAHVFIEMDDEISFLLEKIADQKGRRIFISAADNAHLLSSKVSMKLLQDKLDKMGKVMIVVTTDSLAAKSSLDVGIMTVPNPDGVTSEDWELLEEDSQERFKKSLSKVDAPDRGVIDQNLAKIREAAEKEKSIEEEKQKRLASAMQGKAVDVEGFTMVVGGDILDHKKHANMEDPNVELDSVNEVDTSMENRIRPTRNLAGATLDRGDSYTSENAQRRAQAGTPAVIPMAAEGETNKPKKGISLNMQGLKDRFLKPQILIPVIGGFVLILALMYIFLPKVIVNVEVESIAAETEFEATADKAVTKADIAKLVIPAKEEVVEESGSGDAEATGKGERGEKASGEITIVNSGTENKTVPSGTTVTRNDNNRQYVTTESVVVPSIGASPTVNIEAIAAGEEYNYTGGAGTITFSIQGFADLTGKNTGNISGGSKEQYTAVTKKDIDGLTDRLKKELFAEGESEIKEKHQNDEWVLIEGSIKSDIDGEPQPDAKAGDEKDRVNMSLETKTTALFYNAEELSKIIESKLKEEAAKSEEGNVEEADSFEVSEDTEVTVTIKGVKDGIADVEVSANGLLTPQIKPEDIANKIKGQNWVRGFAILKGIKYVEEDVEATFLPRWFPGFLHRFPADPNRIEVNVKYVKGN